MTVDWPHCETKSNFSILSETHEKPGMIEFSRNENWKISVSLTRIFWDTLQHYNILLQNNYKTYLHVFKLDLRAAILTFSQSPWTLLRHVARDLTTWYPLSTRARENVSFSFIFHLTGSVRSPSLRVAIHHLTCNLLAANVIEKGWKRGRAHGWRGTARSEDFLWRAVAAVTAAQASWVEADWMGHALALPASCYPCFISLRHWTPTTP